MSVLASTILDEIRTVWLNDANGELFEDAVLLPYLKAAYSDLLSELQLYGSQSITEVAIITPVTTGQVSLSLPVDFIAPILLEERTTGSSSLTDFLKMEQRLVLPVVEQTDRLIYWTYREDGIEFVGATTDRDVRLTYQKLLSIIGINSVIPILGADNFLAPRTAELASMAIGQNPQISAFCGQNAASSLETLIAVQVKQTQTKSVRRRPYQANLVMR